MITVIERMCSSRARRPVAAGHLLEGHAVHPHAVEPPLEHRRRPPEPRRVDEHEVVGAAQAQRRTGLMSARSSAPGVSGDHSSASR